MLQLDRITVKAGSTKLVDDVSMRVEPGRVTALIGPNGAGKSTLLRVATGERQPDVGRVLLDERPLESWSPREQARIRAVVSQHSSLNFPFPVLDVVLMGRSPHLERRESRADVDIAWSALELADVADLADRAYTTLSGGERQRVDLARALAQIWEADRMTHRYLLLDEPTASLDLAHQHDALQIASEVSRQDVGVLVVLHDLNLASQYADDIVMLKNGRCLANGRPCDVLIPELIEEAYDVRVLVTPHPCHDCPMVVPMTRETRSLRLKSDGLAKPDRGETGRNRKVETLRPVPDGLRRN